MRELSFFICIGRSAPRVERRRAHVRGAPTSLEQTQTSQVRTRRPARLGPQKGGPEDNAWRPLRPGNVFVFARRAIERSPPKASSGSGGRDHRCGLTSGLPENTRQAVSAIAIAPEQVAEVRLLHEHAPVERERIGRTGLTISRLAVGEPRGRSWGRRWQPSHSSRYRSDHDDRTPDSVLDERLLSTGLRDQARPALIGHPVATLRRHEPTRFGCPTTSLRR